MVLPCRGNRLAIISCLLGVKAERITLAPNAVDNAWFAALAESVHSPSLTVSPETRPAGEVYSLHQAAWWPPKEFLIFWKPMADWETTFALKLVWFSRAAVIASLSWSGGRRRFCQVKSVLLVLRIERIWRVYTRLQKRSSFLPIAIRGAW